MEEQDPILRDVLLRLRKCKNDVYEPSEDTFLFLEALEADEKFLRELDPLICVEIGPGSGIVSSFVSTMFKDRGMLFYGCDLNEKAAEFSKETFLRNGSKRHVMECVGSDLSSCFGDRLEGKVDLLLFNPPYVPSDEAEVGYKDIRAAWAGGKDGMEITKR